MYGLCLGSASRFETAEATPTAKRFSSIDYLSGYGPRTRLIFGRTQQVVESFPPLPGDPHEGALTERVDHPIARMNGQDHPKIGAPFVEVEARFGRPALAHVTAYLGNPGASGLLKSELLEKFSYPAVPSGYCGNGFAAGKVM